MLAYVKPLPTHANQKTLSNYFTSNNNQDLNSLDSKPTQITYKCSGNSVLCARSCKNELLLLEDDMFCEICKRCAPEVVGSVKRSVKTVVSHPLMGGETHPFYVISWNFVRVLVANSWIAQDCLESFKVNYVSLEPRLRPQCCLGSRLTQLNKNFVAGSLGKLTNSFKVRFQYFSCTFSVQLGPKCYLM